MKQAIGPGRMLSLPGLREFYIWSFLSKVSLLTPYFAIFLANRLGVDTAQIALLFATYSVVQMLTEVPLGTLADRIGETTTLQLSSGLALFSIVLLVFGSLPALFVAQALFGIAESAASGVEESLLYRLCQGDDDKDHVDYEAAQPIVTAAAWSGVAVSGFLGTIIVFLFSLSAVGWGGLVAASMAFAMSLALPCVRAKQTGNPQERIDFWVVTRSLRDTPDFRFWFFLGAVVYFVLTVTYFTIQPLLNERAIAGAWNGILYSAVTLFAAYGAHYSLRINGFFKTFQRSLLVGVFLLALTIVGMRYSNSLLAIFFAMAGLRFVWGWLGVSCTTALNSAISADHMRATILSVQSLLSSLLTAAALGSFTLLNLSATAILAVLAVICLAVGGILLLLTKTSISRGEINAKP